MKRITARLVLVAAMTGTLAAAGAPAFAARDICTGTFEIDGCDYCAYNNGSTHQTSNRCDEGRTNYSWQRCGLWINNSCIQGNFAQGVG